MTEEDLETDIAHGGPRSAHSGPNRRAHRQNQWTLPASELSSNQRPERARKKKKEREVSSGGAWEVEEEQKEARRRRRKRKETEKEEKAPFSSVARCRNTDIKITLVEEGIVWNGIDTTAGSGEERREESNPPPGSQSCVLMHK